MADEECHVPDDDLDVAASMMNDDMAAVGVAEDMQDAREQLSAEVDELNAAVNGDPGDAAPAPALAPALVPTPVPAAAAPVYESPWLQKFLQAVAQAATTDSMTQALLLIHSESESADRTNLQRRKQSADRIAQSRLAAGTVQLTDIDGRKVSVAAKVREMEQMRSDSYGTAKIVGHMARWQAATRYVQKFALPSHLPQDMQCIGEPDLTIAPGEGWLYVGNQFGPQPVVI